MNCQRCQENFAVLRDNPQEAPAEALQHLQQCAACAQLFAEYKEAVEQLRALPPVEPPASLPESIYQALAGASPAPSRLWRSWQPVTAGLSLAACVLLVLWAVVLQPVRTEWGAGNMSSGTISNYMPPTFQGMPPQTEKAFARGSVRRNQIPEGSHGAQMSKRTQMGASRSSEELWRQSKQSQAATAETHDMLAWGAWGKDLRRPAHTKEATPGQSEHSEKPVGTFAAEDASEAVEPPALPLQRQSGVMELIFTPPAERPVGQPVVGELKIVSQAEAIIAVRVLTQPGLYVTNAPAGMLYQGPLRQGETLALPLRLFAWRAGTHRLRVQLSGDTPGVTGDLKIELANFVGTMGKNGATPVTLKFYEKPARQAIRELAAAAGARVVLREDLEHRLVTLDFSAGVPFAAALRILCDVCGYHMEEREGVFYIYP